MTTITDEEVQALLDGATPGPWVALSSNDVWRDGFGSAAFGVFDRVARVEATFRPTYQGGPKAQCTGAEDANARLIAATPTLARDLLAARAELARVTAERDALAAQVVVLRGALDKARDPGRAPDYCYDDEWEYTMRFDQWQDLVDSHDLSAPVEVNTLFKGPTKYVVNVPNSRDESGVPDGWDTVMFDSEAEARAALQPTQEPKP